MKDLELQETQSEPRAETGGLVGRGWFSCREGMEKKKRRRRERERESINSSKCTESGGGGGGGMCAEYRGGVRVRACTVNSGRDLTPHGPKAPQSCSSLFKP